MKQASRIVRVIAVALVVIGVAIQFIRVDRTNPPVESDVGAPADVDAILRRACYDCHSNESRWPWYSYVAPASWFVVGHVNHARGDLNFSQWPVFDFELQEHAFRDIEEQISKGKMPLPSYTWVHRGARLSDNDRDVLLRWARSLGGIE